MPSASPPRWFPRYTQARIIVLPAFPKICGLSVVKKQSDSHITQLSRRSPHTFRAVGQRTRLLPGFFAELFSPDKKKSPHRRSYPWGDPQGEKALLSGRATYPTAARLFAELFSPDKKKIPSQTFVSVGGFSRGNALLSGRATHPTATRLFLPSFFSPDKKKNPLTDVRIRGGFSRCGYAAV